LKKFFLSLLLFILFPLLTYAEVDYDITDYYIESHILENGDLKVKELFVLDGTFNGYERDIIYTNNSLNLTEDAIDFSNNAIYNASGITDVSIKAKYVDDVNFNTMNENDFDEFVLTNYASNGSKGNYIKSNLYGGERYRMYYASDNERVAFCLTYTITDAVVIHNDVAELYWNFIGSDYADDLDNLNIKVYLPEADTSDNFRIWAHGDLTGEINFIIEDNQKVGAYATMDKVEAYDPVDIRLTFDKSLIKDSTNLDVTEEDALNKIIEVETERADEANALREELKVKYYIALGLTITYIIGLVITIIYVIRKYGITKKSDFDYEYNREFIEDYNVEVIDYLLNKNNISPNAMSASIMNMIYKKNIKAEEIESKSKNKKDYKFTLITEDNLNETEQCLINFLFKNIGEKDENNIYSFTTIDLRKYAGSNITYNTFINSYTSWKKCVINDGKAEGFYENVNAARIHGIVWFILAIALNFIIGALNAFVAFAFIIPYFALAFMIYTLLINKKTEKGSLHYDKWMAFKRFLKDFGNFKEKELPEIILWEKYLVYAVIFGIADKVQKDMNVKIQELETIYGPNYAPTITDIYIYNNICDSVHYSVNHAVRSSYNKQVANSSTAGSSSSSGGGFGGGFSSGGGFGGGGGGGRGF